MSSLIRIYDEFTGSNRNSLVINAISTGYMLYSVLTPPRYYPITPLTPHIYLYPTLFAISVIAGAALALLANRYLIHHNTVENQRERNNVYTTLSLSSFLVSGHIYKTYFFTFLQDYINRNCYEWHTVFDQATNVPFIIKGLRTGFLFTNLLLQMYDIKSEDNRQTEQLI